MNRSRTVQLTALAVAVGVTAGILYFFDARSGRRRRAMLRDRLDRSRRRLAENLQSTADGVRNGSRGVLGRIRSLFEDEHPAPERLVRRIHTRIGQVVEDSDAVGIRADAEGTVTLTGRVMQDEVHPLLRHVAATRGVHSVNNFLEVQPTGLRWDLQGGPELAPPPPESYP